MATVTISADYTAKPRLGYLTGGIADWSTAWAAATGNVLNGSPTVDVAQTSNTVAVLISLLRTPLFFDTLALGASVTITAVVLRLYGHSHGDMDDIVIQNGQPTYPSYPIASGDYDKSHYSGDGGSKLIDDFVDDDWNEITLNSTGRGWINKTGQTKLMLRVSSDIAGTQPSVGQSRWTRYRSGGSDSSLRPQLVITYTRPPGEGAGVIAVVEERLHYVDTYGVERYFQGEAV